MSRILDPCIHALRFDVSFSLSLRFLFYVDQPSRMAVVVLFIMSSSSHSTGPIWQLITVLCFDFWGSAFVTNHKSFFIYLFKFIEKYQFY